MLNEARDSAEKLLNVLHEAADDKKPLNCRKCAHKEYLKNSRSRKHTAQKTHEEIRMQLSYLKRDLDAIDDKLLSLTDRQS